MKVYTVLDKVAQAYQNPFFALNDGMVIRAFSQAVNDKQTTLNNSPESFVLTQTGEFDEQTGVLTGNDVGPVPVIHGTECIEDRVDRDDLVEILDKLSAIEAKIK